MFPVCNLAARPRRAVPETAFDGTLISDASFEKLASDLFAKNIGPICIEKPRFLTRQHSVLEFGRSDRFVHLGPLPGISLDNCYDRGIVACRGSSSLSKGE